MIMQRLIEARKRKQGGFTLVELLVVIAILGILAAIVLFNISGVNASAACNAMKTDGATIQSAADLYYNTNLLYPVTGGDKATPLATDTVNIPELLTSNLLHQAPPVAESFAYGTFGTPANYSRGTVRGTTTASAACIYNP